MKKVRVGNWYKLDESTNLENQVKAFIAQTVEGYINGIQFGYEPMTKENWKQYIIDDLNRDIRMGMIVNGTERTHMRFLGNARFHELIDIYLDNYKDVQKYIIG